MPRLGTVFCVAIAAALVVVVFSSISLDRGTPSQSTSANEVVVRSDASPGSATWSRIRWSFAGIALAAVALVAVRQFRMLAMPLSRRSAETSTERTQESRPVLRETYAPGAGELGPAEWIPSVHGASSGD